MRYRAVLRGIELPTPRQIFSSSHEDMKHWIVATWDQLTSAHRETAYIDIEECKWEVIRRVKP